MKKLVWLFMLGILFTGCSKKAKGDDDSGNDQNHEPGYVAVYLNDQKVFEGNANQAVYISSQHTVSAEVIQGNNSNGPTKLGIAFGNFIPPTGSNSNINVNPSSGESTFVMLSETQDINLPDGHVLNQAVGFSGQLKHVTDKKFEATGTLVHYYDPNNPANTTQMTFKVIVIVKTII